MVEEAFLAILVILLQGISNEVLATSQLLDSIGVILNFCEN
jgi:hypothetical protein